MVPLVNPHAPRRAFLQGLAVGLLMGIVEAVPGLSRLPVKPERPITPTITRDVQCPKCGFRPGDVKIVQNGPASAFVDADRLKKAARYAGLVMQDHLADMVIAGHCPTCAVIDGMIYGKGQVFS